MKRLILALCALLVTTPASAIELRGISVGAGSAFTGGTDKFCLFNDAGTFGEDSGCQYDKATDTLTVVALKVTGLTAARVPFVGTGGLLTDDPALLFASSTAVFDAGTILRLGGSATSATSGAFRMQKNTGIAMLNNAGTGNIWPVLVGNATNDEMEFGTNATQPTRIATNATAGTPTTPLNGQWWVECSGTTPNRSCSLKIVEANGTRTIATSATY